MTRKDFLKRVIQVGLFALLSFVVFKLKNRIVTDENCSVCPENGSCPGKKECSKY
jgi:hypothetical protein